MARALTPTKLSLDEIAAIHGLNPLHFNQIFLDAQLQRMCQQSVFQYDWQTSDRVSREQMARAIAKAEGDLEEVLGYRLLPAWEVEEVHPLGRSTIRPDIHNIGMSTIRGEPLGERADFGYFITGGVRAFAEVEPGIAVTYEDVDGDGWKEKATATFNDEDTALCEFRAYYPDHFEDEDPAAWEIRGARFTRSGTVVTVTMPREQLLAEAAMASLIEPRGVRGTDEGAEFFIEQIAIGREYNDPQTQATLVWNGPRCGCASGDCSTCSLYLQPACLALVGDDRLSYVRYEPGTWDADEETFIRTAFAIAQEPAAIRLSYLAGYQDKRRECPRKQMDRDLASIVAIYAASLLDRPVCDCKGSDAGIRRWQKDLAAVDGAEELEIYNVPRSDLENPFGTRYGAVEAWRRIKGRAGSAKHPIGKAIDA